MQMLFLFLQHYDDGQARTESRGFQNACEALSRALPSASRAAPPALHAANDSEDGGVEERDHQRSDQRALLFFVSVRLSFLVHMLNLSTVKADERMRAMCSLRAACG
jgi:hypothetical protein